MVVRVTVYLLTHIIVRRGPLCRLLYGSTSASSIARSSIIHVGLCFNMSFFVRTSVEDAFEISSREAS
jgi:hypothetical protein